MKTLNALAAALLIVGGLNWGLVALAEFDLVAWLVGENWVAREISVVAEAEVGRTSPVAATTA